MQRHVSTIYYDILSYAVSEMIFVLCHLSRSRSEIWAGGLRHCDQHE